MKHLGNFFLKIGRTKRFFDFSHFWLKFEQEVTDVSETVELPTMEREPIEYHLEHLYCIMCNRRLECIKITPVTWTFVTFTACCGHDQRARSEFFHSLSTLDIFC